MPVQPIRPGFHTITPYLIGKKTPQLLEFVTNAFEAVVESRKERPDGSVMHAEVRIGDSMVMMGEPVGEFGPMPTSIYLYVTECDRVYQKALDAGGTSVSEMTTMPSGERYGGVRDCCGNVWWIATHVENLSPEEQDQRWKKFRR